MRVETLSYVLTIFTGILLLNGVVNAEGCAQVKITADRALQQKLVMWTAFCKGGTADWHPLEVNTLISIPAGTPFKIADLRTKVPFFKIDHVLGTVQITCTDSSKGPQCTYLLLLPALKGKAPSENKRTDNQH